MRRRYSMFRPETHGILRQWRGLAETYDPPRLLLGEAYSLDVEQWAGYFGDGDELDLAFAFMLTHAPLHADELRAVVASVEAALPDDAWPCWTGSNHDIGRLATRWAEGDGARVRCALTMLLTLRGRRASTTGTSSRRGRRGRFRAGRRLRDAVARSRPHADAVDACGRGRLARSVAPARRHEPERRGATSRFGLDAALHARPHRVAARAAGAPIGSLRGDLSARTGAWAWRRGDDVLVALNLGGEPVEIGGVDGRSRSRRTATATGSS